MRWKGEVPEATQTVSQPQKARPVVPAQLRPTYAVAIAAARERTDSRCPFPSGTSSTAATTQLQSHNCFSFPQRGLFPPGTSPSYLSHGPKSLLRSTPHFWSAHLLDPTPTAILGSERENDLGVGGGLGDWGTLLKRRMSNKGALFPCVCW